MRRLADTSGARAACSGDGWWGGLERDTAAARAVQLVNAPLQVTSRVTRGGRGEVTRLTPAPTGETEINRHTKRQPSSQLCALPFKLPTRRSCKVKAEEVPISEAEFPEP